MIDEDYCSLEVSKLLKEKGFNELVHYEYHYMISIPQFYKKSHNFNGSEYANCVTEWFSAPTHQMAIKWLRAQGIYITIVFGAYPSLKKVFWVPQIDTLEGFALPPDDFYNEYDEYEQAVEVALQYALENLI